MKEINGTRRIYAHDYMEQQTRDDEVKADAEGGRIPLVTYRLRKAIAVNGPTLDN